MIIKLIWLVPLFPLIGFLIISLLNKKLPTTVASIIANLAILASFGVSIAIFAALKTAAPDNVSHTIVLFDWISAGTLKTTLSFLVDPLSSLMLLIITGIGALIHLYSAGYMHHDEGHNKFFSYLNLFIFFMMLLVLGSNYLVMFVGWEGVGLCSYLLIGFWFKNINYSNAARKAFIMNRIGDLGFLLGIILIFVTFGSIEFSDVFSQLTNGSSVAKDQPVIIAITLLLFVGAMGKSAQLPLFTWLPDAMAGPTPVSALIHAATMVTAGIYMIARSNILYTLAPFTLEIVAIIGLATALFAATIGLVQNDIKKVLAYSTVSQLGFMFLALGLGSYTSAMFHVTTHAFFKALLFLGAGSVIHAVSGEQDIRNMGGLKKHLPITFLTFAVGTFAISGFPPFSGFFSKDEILAHAFAHNKVYWLLGLVASMMTTFYMFRLFFVTFFGEFRGTKEQLVHLHESPKTMTIPLIVLGALSIVGGLMGIPEALHGSHMLKQFLAPVFAASDLRILPHVISHETEYMLMAIAVLTIVILIFVARAKYVKNAEVPVPEGEKLSAPHKLLYNKYYVDELYDTLFVKPIAWLSKQFHAIVELKFIDSIVNSLGNLVVWCGSTLRLAQTGNIGVYLLIMVLSAILILFINTLL